MSFPWAAVMVPLVLAATVLFLMLVDTITTRARNLFGPVALTGALAAVMWILLGPEVAGGPATAFSGMLVDDGLARGFGLIVAVALALVVLLADPDLDGHGVAHRGEFYALLASAALGMVLMAWAGNLIMVFLGLELFSLSLYLLCLFFPREGPSQEASLKYFILSSLASAVMLYGMALLYGATGSTWLSEIVASPVEGMAGFLELVGLVLVLCGLAFKLAAVPFHLWSPDVYEGAPTSVTAFMSVATKAAALAVLWRLTGLMATPLVAHPTLDTLTTDTLAPLTTRAVALLTVLSGLSILVGNVMALAQKRFKRLLACSGIAQAGYLLIGVVSFSHAAAPGAVLFYLMTYAFMNLGAFAGALWLERSQGRPVSVENLDGLAGRQPGLAAGLAVCLISLAGLPPTGGFLAKLYLFGAAIQADQVPLVALAVIGSLVGAAYYLAPVARMYMREPRDLSPLAPPAPTVVLALGVCVLGILATGLAPELFLRLATSLGAGFSGN